METTQLKKGQVGPYKDSIYRWKIESELSETEVKDYCTGTLMPCEKEHPSGNYSGTSDFPFGLNSYFKFENKGEGTFLYTVCVPYCD